MSLQSTQRFLSLFIRSSGLFAGALSGRRVGRSVLRNFCFLAIVIALFSTLSVRAEDEEELPPESQYVAVEPAFVTNYGGPGRLRYMKVEVSLRVKGEQGEISVTRHMPAIRDALLNLFALQTNDTIGTAVGKEGLRKQAFQSIDSLLAVEDGESLAEDLLFTEFVIHR